MNYGPPGLSFSSGINGLYDGNSSFTRNQTTAISYTTTWIHGRHNVQYGGDFRWQQFNSLAQANPRGSFGFTGLVTSNVVNNVPQPGTGNAFADFLLGRAGHQWHLVRQRRQVLSHEDGGRVRQ